MSDEVLWALGPASRAVSGAGYWLARAVRRCESAGLPRGELEDLRERADELHIEIVRLRDEMGRKAEEEPVL